jgi:2-desacetyl-2-hydroxyethyl bacteriochlorophyllide A dehydrogenase
MKAIRMVQPGHPLEMQEIPPPKMGHRDVLVKIKAAGICHSDAHYRAGTSKVEPLPMTLGHEVAGVIESIGADVTSLKPGDRVCLHYMVTCGHCSYCNQGNEQFCSSGKMIGKYTDGGYAEYISIPERSAFLLPDEISFEQGAIMMCSSATSFHALYKARMQPGETVAVFGAGGLGISAIQLARAFGALEVFAVDIRESKLERAQGLGAIPVNAFQVDPVEEILRLTHGRGVDVAIELVGLQSTMSQAARSLAVLGRASLVGISTESFPVTPYHELINKEAEIIGVSDHLAQELPRLIEWVRVGKLNLSGVVTQTVPLEAGAVNAVLDRLERFGEDVRVVITPELKK